MFVNSGSASHSRRNTDDFGILPGYLNQRLRKYVRVGWYRTPFLFRLSRQYMKGSNGVVLYRLPLGWRVALALLRKHVHQCRSVNLLDVFQCGHHLDDVMPVDGTDILETQALE